MAKLSFLVLAALVLCAAPASAVPVLLGSYTENADGTFTYDYVLSGVDDGRKVTGVEWLVLEGLDAEQPAYLPLIWNIPYYWSFLPGHDGPLDGGVWMANTGASVSRDDKTIDVPIGPNSGALLAGDTRLFSFTTGYAPRIGTYMLIENAIGQEVDYQYLFGTTWLPDYDGTRVETAWTGQDTMNWPTSVRVVEPPTLLLMLLGGTALIRRVRS